MIHSMTTNSLHLNVRLFARCRDLAGADAVTVDVPAPATVGKLREAFDLGAVPVKLRVRRRSG